MYVKKFALIILIMILITTASAYAVHNYRSRLNCKELICFIDAKKFYMGFKDAVIIRVDDFTVDSKLAYKIPDNLVHPREWFINYQYNLIDYVLKKHPEVKLVVGLITGSIGGNASSWRIYRILVHKYDWEIACHTRLHVRPPRSKSDVLGCIMDIEGNITGYKVVTYIPPFGKTSKQELELLEKHGILIVMKTTPLQLRVPKNWISVHYTVKMAHHLPWSYWLRITHYIAEKIHGLIVVYTHATSYDWRSWGELKNSFEKMINIVEDGKTWITTPRQILSYEVERGCLRITKINSTAFKIILIDKNKIIPEPTPVTLEFVSNHRIKEVLVNGKPIPRVQKPVEEIMEAYYTTGDKILVTIKPPAILEFVLR